MAPINLDHLIVGAFLLVTFYIGWRSGRGIKNIRSYAIADKIYGTGALVLTYMATTFAGASLINGVAQVFSNGIIMTVALSGLIITFIIRGLFIAPKVAAFDNCITMGDLMAHFYGAYSKLIAGILGLLNSICFVSMEIIVLGIVFESLLGIKASWGVVIGGVTLALYSAHGGIKSVTITDVLQFLVLIVIIPITATIAVGHAGGIKALFTQVPAAKFEILHHKSFSYYLTLFLMWSIVPAGTINPAIMQRMLLAKRPSQLRNQYLITSALDPALRLIIMLIGLTGIVLYPNLKAINIFPHIVQELLPIGVRGLAIAGALAVSMSTIDSYLHAAGLTLTHDVLKPLCDRRNIVIDELAWAKYSTLALGLLAILIGTIGAGVTTDGILGFAFTALGFTAPLLMFPLLSGIMGLKTDARSFYTALPVTLAAFVLSTLYLPPTLQHLVLLISIFANGITFFAMHVVQHKGFALVHRTQNTQVERLWRPQAARFLHQLKAYLPTPSNVVRYSQQKVIQYGAPYLLFSIFCCVNFIVPYFMWTQTAHQAYGLILPLRLVGALLCGLLLVKEKWPSVLRPYMPTFWHFTVLYCLPFMSTVMLLLTQGSVEWLMNIAMTILFLILLVDWMSFVGLSVLGILLGVGFYTSVVGPAHITLEFRDAYLLVYQVFFATLIGLIFARRKEQGFLERIQHFKILGDTVRQEATYALHTLDKLTHAMDARISSYVQQAQEQQQSASKQEVSIEVTTTGLAHLNDLTHIALELVSQSEQALNILRNAFKSNIVLPHLAPCSVKECVEKGIQACFFHQEPDSLQTDFHADFEAAISPTHFTYVILTILRYLLAYEAPGRIKVKLAPQKVYITTYGITLSPSEGKQLFQFMPGEEHTQPAKLGLGICKLIMEAMEGHILCRAGKKAAQSYLEFVLTLPAAHPQP